MSLKECDVGAGDVAAAGVKAGCDSDNVYVSQLREVFDSCDISGTGRIDRDGLLRLCDTLQLSHEYSQTLANLCSGTSQSPGTVTFNDFKDGFIHILAAPSTDNPSPATTRSSKSSTVQPDDSEEVSPKYVKDGKKYGRRSKPEQMTGITRNNGAISTMYPDGSSRDPERSEEHKKLKLDLNDGVAEDFDSYIKQQRRYKCKLKKSLERLSSMESLLSSEHSTSAMSTPRFVASINVSRTASLTLNQSARLKEQIESMGEDLCKSDSGMSVFRGKSVGKHFDEEKEYLRRIWSELRIGSDGYISKYELVDVCHYIDLQLSNSSLETLFTKLDMDQDGYIGFDEFVEGFSIFSNDDVVENSKQQCSPRLNNEEPSGTVTEDDHHTEHLLSLVNDDDDNKSGIFSCLDQNHQGFATVHDIVDLWESKGIEEGYKMLQHILTGNASSTDKTELHVTATNSRLQPSQEINLHELTYKLLQKMLSSSQPPTKNPFFILAMGSFQSEIDYLRSSTHHIMSERDKLKSDISEANARALLLAEEVDERQIKIEKYNTRKIKSLEQRYEDQIRTLQAYVEQERDVASKDVLKIKQQLEEEREKFGDHECALKKRITILEQENSRLDRECSELHDTVERLEKQTSRQQNELQDMLALQDRVNELENGEEVLTHAQYSDIVLQLQRASSDNKGLTDRNDELASEIEGLRQQLSILSKRRRKHGGQNKTTSCSAGGNSNEEDESTSNDDRSTSSDGASPIVQFRRKAGRMGKLKQEEDALKFELVKQHHDKEMSDMLEKFNIKYRELEEQFQSNVATMEERCRIEKMAVEKKNRDLLEKLDQTENEFGRDTALSTNLSVIHPTDKTGTRNYHGASERCHPTKDIAAEDMEQEQEKLQACDSVFIDNNVYELMDTAANSRVAPSELIGSTKPVTPQIVKDSFPIKTPHADLHVTIEELQEQNMKLQSELEAVSKTRACDAREERISRVMHDLYVENANLMSSLQSCEKRQLDKDAENHVLRDRCRALEELLKHKLATF